MREQMIEARAILQENRQLKAALQLREETPNSSPPAASSAPRSRARAASPSSPPAPATACASECRSARPRPDRPGHRCRRSWPRGFCSSPTAPASSRRGCFAPARPVISQGRGDGTVDLRPLEVGRNPFRRGDIVITSGTGGLYPPLVPIARVSRLDGDGAIALPLADPADDQLRDRPAALRARRAGGR